MSKSSVAHKLAEEFINVLKYNPDLKHDEKILSLELRLEKLIDDVEKACEESHKRQSVVQQPAQEEQTTGHPMLYFGRNMGDDNVIVSEVPNEREQMFGQALKSRGPAN